MSTDLVPTSQQVTTFDIMEDAWTLAQRIAKTELVPTALRNKPESVMAVVLMGHEVGLAPMASLQQINMIQGTPAPSAQAMRALVQSAGHELWPGDQTATRAVWHGRRAGGDETVTVTYTMDEAKRAKLDGKDNWRRMPQEMLSARASSRLCRMLFADVLLGISYTREELEDGDLFSDEPTSNGNGAAPVATQTRKAAGTRKAAAKKAATPAPAVDAPPDPFDDGEPDTEQRRRSVLIITACNAAGVDRHELIRAVTVGAKSSSMAVDGPETAKVLNALRDIEDGKARLHGGVLFAVDPDDEPVDAELVDGPDAGMPSDGPGPGGSPAAAPPAGSELEWGLEEWGGFFAEHGVSQVKALKALRALCGELGQEPPSGMAEVLGDASLTGLLRGLVEEGGIS